MQAVQDTESGLQIPVAGRVDALRVYLVDDHPIVRGGLRDLINSQEDMTIVGEAGDGETAVREIPALAPHIVVMDVSMPGMGGAEATDRVRRECPAAKILALSAHEDRAYVRLLLKAGAAGYVAKRTAAEDLVRAIRAVASGGIYLDPAVGDHVLVDGQNGPTTDFRRERNDLSERELEVMQLIAQGHPIKQIAARLHVSTRTVETYKSRGMEKAGLKSRADLIRYAIHCGWLKTG